MLDLDAVAERHIARTWEYRGLTWEQIKREERLLQMTECKPTTVFVVLEDFHYECSTLVAVCRTLESAKAAAQGHSNRDIMPHEDEDGPRPTLPEWSDGGVSRSTAYFHGGKSALRTWVSKGPSRDYEIYEMEVMD